MESAKDSKDRHEQVRGWQNTHVGNPHIVRIREVRTSGTVQNIPLTKGGVPIVEGRRILVLIWGPCEVTIPWGLIRSTPIDTITQHKLGYIKTVLHTSPISHYSGAAIVNIILYMHKSAWYYSSGL